MRRPDLLQLLDGRWLLSARKDPEIFLEFMSGNRQEDVGSIVRKHGRQNRGALNSRSVQDIVFGCISFDGQITRAARFANTKWIIVDDENTATAILQRLSQDRAHPTKSADIARVHPVVLCFFASALPLRSFAVRHRS